MKWTNLLIVFLAALACDKFAAASEDAWIDLFDGKTLQGWKASEDPASFTVRDGLLIAHSKSPRSHLFYVGPTGDAVFQDFELKAEVMATPGSNSGIYFHTKYQESGFPNDGHEVQINNSHKNKARTGSLFGVVDLNESSVRDNQWFTLHVVVRGKRVVIQVNDKTTVDYVEPEGYKHPTYTGRQVAQGTFAVQAHDPGSTAYFKSIRVRRLDSSTKP